MERVILHAHERSPAGISWGFFAYDDAPAGIGGGCGSFLWFDSHREMIEFIGTYLPFWSAGSPRYRPTEVQAEVMPILAELCSTSQSPEHIRARLNQVLTGYATILWWGQFYELLIGKTEFAREVRLWFRSSRMPDPPDAHISVDEQKEFTEAIQEYGL
jgi:hypothetical protein